MTQNVEGYAQTPTVCIGSTCPKPQESVSLDADDMLLNLRLELISQSTAAAGKTPVISDRLEFADVNQIAGADRAHLRHHDSRHRDRSSRLSHELDLITGLAVMDVDDRAAVARREAFFRKILCKYSNIVFFNQGSISSRGYTPRPTPWVSATDFSSPVVSTFPHIPAWLTGRERIHPGT